MEKEKKKNYFVREDLVSDQHVHHESEIKEEKKSMIVMTGAILNDPFQPKNLKKEACEVSDYFLG